MTRNRMALADPAAFQKPDRLRQGLDIAERLFVVGLFLRLAFQVFGSVAGGANPVNLLLLVSEGIVVVLVMLRRPANEISLKPLDWFLAFAATAGPLLVQPAHHVKPLSPPAFAAGLIITGIVFQVACKLTLRRSFGLAPANRGLIVAGPYKLVRHPIYASYLINQVGFLLLNPTAWNVSVLAASLVIQVFRIEAEERLLAHDAGHAEFRKATPYRLAPGIY
jgi:protein-S-isoprenylcysteine O-methyltransferase Ste14